MYRGVDDPVVERIAREADTFLETIRRVYDDTSYRERYKLEAIWSENTKWMLERQFPATNNAVHRLQIAMGMGMLDSNPLIQHEQIRPGTFALMCDWFLAFLEKQGVRIHDFDHFIQESPMMRPEYLKMHRDRLISPNFLRVLWYSVLIDRHCRLSRDPFIMMELGGGYGAFARVLKLLHPRTTCIMIDLPESLYQCVLFLRLQFPAAKVCYVCSEDDPPDPIDDYDFLFVPTMFANQFVDQPVELFCNTASLGEMDNDVIDYWMDYIQNRLDPRYVFMVNRFLNLMDPEKSAERLQSNTSSVGYDSRWSIRDWCLDPADTQCPYYLTRAYARYLRIIAERIPRGSANRAYDTAVGVLLQTALEDDSQIWEDVPTLLPKLSVDMGRDSHLFKLWESIRLRPSTENVRMMVHFLKPLQGDMVFEETSHYRKELERHEKSDPTRNATSG